MNSQAIWLRYVIVFSIAYAAMNIQHTGYGFIGYFSIAYAAMNTI